MQKTIGLLSLIQVKVSVVMAAALVLRFIHLDADPPALISRDFITDEGWWSHNARNAFLYGHWSIGNDNLGIYSAYLYNSILYGVFRLFGIGYESLRLLPAFAGWLTVVLIFLLVRREVNRRAAILAALLLGFSNLHIMYSRTGFPESTMVLFLVLMLWLWSLRREHWLFGLAAGVAFSLMVLTKITAVYFIPGLILFALVQNTRNAISRSQLLLFLCGVTLVASLYSFLWVIPNFHEWLGYNLRNGSGDEWPSAPADVIAGILKLSGSSFFAAAPIVTSLSLLAIAGFIVDASRNGLRTAIRSAREIDVTTIALISGYMLSLSVTIHQPERRFIPVLVLMVILAAGLLEKASVSFEDFSIRKLTRNANHRTWGWFVLLFLLPAVGIMEIRRGLVLTDWMLKGLIIAILVWVAHRMGRGLWPHRFRRELLIASAVIFLTLFSFLTLSALYRAFAFSEHGSVLLSGIKEKKLLVLHGGEIFAAAGILIGCLVLFYLIVRDRRRRWQWVVVTFLLVEFVQISVWLFAPTYTMRSANATLAERLSDKDTVATHYESTMLSSRAVMICRSERRGLNLDAFERFDPRYVFVLRRDNWRDYDLEQTSGDEWPPPGNRVPVKVGIFDLCPVPMRGARFRLELYQLH